MPAPDKTTKNNALRALDAHHIAYHVTTYSDALHTAPEIADVLGAPLEQVFKTLVVLPDAPNPRPMLVVLPGAKELDLRTLASAIGEKKLRMATQAEAERLTGLQVGGISALALLPKHWRVYIDDTALLYDLIYISGGQRGLNVRLLPGDYIALTRAVPLTLP